MKMLAAIGIMLTLSTCATAPIMAQETSQTLWFLQGVIAIPGQEDVRMRYAVPSEPGKESKPALLVFSSKEQCEMARATDPEISEPLVLLEAAAKKDGGTMTVTCERFVHPKPGIEI